MPFNFFLSSDLHDIELTRERNIRITKTDVELISQKVENYIRTVAGEYFLNRQIGLPYFDRIFRKKVSLQDVSNLFKATILSVPEVVEIISYDFSFDGRKRLYSVNTEMKYNVDGVVNTTRVRVTV